VILTLFIQTLEAFSRRRVVLSRAITVTGCSPVKLLVSCSCQYSGLCRWY